VAIRWYELRGVNDKWQVHQRGTYAPDSMSRWIGTMAMDKEGNILMGYSAASSSLAPSIRISGRTKDTPPNMLASEALVISGKGSQTMQRWGDYSSMSLDPSDNCTFWLTAQYIEETGIFAWRTFIVHTRFKNCTSERK
jgi:hypothetical protein